MMKTVFSEYKIINKIQKIKVIITFVVINTISKGKQFLSKYMNMQAFLKRHKKTQKKKMNLIYKIIFQIIDKILKDKGFKTKVNLFNIMVLNSIIEIII